MEHAPVENHEKFPLPVFYFGRKSRTGSWEGEQLWNVVVAKEKKIAEFR
jgi:hypothetical protein